MYGVKLIGFVFTAKVPRVIWALIVLHTEITARLMTILLVLCVCVVGFLGGRGCSCSWRCYVFNLFNDQHWNFKVQYNNKPIFTLCSPMLRNSQMSDEFFNQDIFISNFSLMIIICLWGTCCKVGWKFQNFDHKMSFIAGGHFQGK